MMHPVRASALLVLVGAVSSGPVAMLVVTQLAPQPAWRDAALFGAHYSSIQALPYLLGFVLLGGFVLFAAACVAHSGHAQRVIALAGLVLTAVYASMVFTNYMLQVGYVPRTVGSDPLAAARVTMANPSSLGWFLEMFGYAALGLGTAFLAFCFGGSARGSAIRWLLVANAVVSVLGAFYTGATDRWVFSTAGLVSFGAWNALVITCFGLIALTPNAGLLRADSASTEG
jgi:hypothetical protein